MRWMPLVILLAAGAADAKDCVPPKIANDKGIQGLGTFADCMIDKVAALEQENARLRKDLEKITLALAKFPGEFRNDNGRVTRTGGDNVVQATFVSSARRSERPVALAIDQAPLEALCAVGCTVTLAMSAEGLRKNDPGSVSTVATCAFRYAPGNGTWSQGGGCGEAVSGTDGDGGARGKEGGAVIASSGEACILADSAPGLGADPEVQLLDGDRAKGLYLVAIPSRFTGTEARFRCELKLAR